MASTMLRSKVSVQQWPDVWDEAAIAALPDDGHRYEVYAGALVVNPPANEYHQGAERFLLLALHQAAPTGWRVFTDLGVMCGEDLFVPDLVVLYPRVPRYKGLYRPAVDVALAVEVESPSTRVNDRNLKPAAYAEAGIPHFWRVEMARTGCIVHMHDLVDLSYTLVHSLKPGDSVSIEEPYPVTFANDFEV